MRSKDLFLKSLLTSFRLVNSHSRDASLTSANCNNFFFSRFHNPIVASRVNLQGCVNRHHYTDTVHRIEHCSYKAQRSVDLLKSTVFINNCNYDGGSETSSSPSTKRYYTGIRFYCAEKYCSIIDILNNLNFKIFKMGGYRITKMAAAPTPTPLYSSPQNEPDYKEMYKQTTSL